ncbi:DNA repair protein RecN [bacterium]|nr:MAG: DNA repair protein RecN [bacterium]
MLKTLSIKNFALIEEAEIQFELGLNIITGETGAGKSILLGALSMILGERAATDNIRSGAERSVIEGTFTIENNQGVRCLLQDNDIEVHENEILIRREISLKGQNRCFVNDTLITTSLLKSIGDLLVDLHGQHDHQSLLHQEIHVDILDAYGRLESVTNEVKQRFKRIGEIKNRIEELENHKQTYLEKRELFQHQLKEIKDISPEISEDTRLIQEEKIISNSEKLFELTKKIYDALYDTDRSVVEILGETSRDFEEIRKIDERLNEILTQFVTAKITLEEVSRWVGDYHQKLTFEPERLEEIRMRIAAIQRLKKKYGSIEEILAKKDQIQEAINISDNFDFELNKEQKQLAIEIENYVKICAELTAQRRKFAVELDKKVVLEMRNLGMEHAIFKTEIRYIENLEGFITVNGVHVNASSTGLDFVEFMISTNLGESPKPLVKVASGGEVSRIMLSLKSALAGSDQIPTLVFDEIDVGISGRIAQAVGKSLYHLAQSHQTICITHLPQIAGFSQSHYSVEKHFNKNKTVTTINKLSQDDKIREVAKLLGGEHVTDASLKNAKELVSSLST